MQLDDLLTPEEVAARYRMTKESLSNWRGKRQGPKWIVIGDGKQGRVMYRVRDVVEYEQRNLVTEPTRIVGNKAK